MNDISRFICCFSELSDPDARAFTIGTGDWPLKGFVVRQGDQVFAYLNRCPHAGHPLNLLANDFFSPDQTVLMCKSHGACFEIATGLCVAGPCPGARLRPIALRIEHDDIMLVDDPEILAAQFA
ncbi:MAG TPA: Rieske 2Fe-2S domain-containing protein [Steroidobacteraceae bacterium]|nr:Rieske 2Fe-2S domain-containing protein [Steroidobacteraceae bacterium]